MSSIPPNTTQYLDPDKDEIDFHKAVDSENLSQVLEMISDGVNVNQPDWMWGMTPLEIAVEKGYTKIVQVLLNAGANPNFGVSSLPLDISASKGYTKITEKLIKADAQVSIENFDALKMAARQGYLKIIKLLVEAGANVNAYNGEISFPLADAMIGCNQEIFDYLSNLTFPENRESAKKSALFHAVGTKNPTIIHFLSKIGVNLDISLDGKNGKTALMLACEFDNLEIVEVLLNLKINIHATDHQGKTALMYAAQCSNPGQLDFIKNSTSAQVEQILKPKKKIIKYLIESGADINIRDNKDQTAIDYAINYGSRKIVNLLTEIAKTQ